MAEMQIEMRSFQQRMKQVVKDFNEKFVIVMALGVCHTYCHPDLKPTIFDDFDIIDHMVKRLKADSIKQEDAKYHERIRRKASFRMKLNCIEFAYDFIKEHPDGDFNRKLDPLREIFRNYSKLRRENQDESIIDMPSSEKRIGKRQ